MRKVQVTKDFKRWHTIALLPEKLPWEQVAGREVFLPFDRRKWKGTRIVPAATRRPS